MAHVYLLIDRKDAPLVVKVPESHIIRQVINWSFLPKRSSRLLRSVAVATLDKARSSYTTESLYTAALEEQEERLLSDFEDSKTTFTYCFTDRLSSTSFGRSEPSTAEGVHSSEMEIHVALLDGLLDADLEEQAGLKEALVKSRQELLHARLSVIMFVALHELVHHLRYATTHKRTRPRCYPETRPQVSGAERGFHWEEIAFGGIVGVLHHHSKTIFQPSGIVIKTPAPQTRDTKVATGVKRGAEVLSEEDSKVVLHYIAPAHFKNIVAGFQDIGPDIISSYFSAQGPSDVQNSTHITHRLAEIVDIIPVDVADNPEGTTGRSPSFEDLIVAFPSCSVDVYQQ